MTSTRVLAKDVRHYKVNLPTKRARVWASFNNKMDVYGTWHHMTENIADTKNNRRHGEGTFTSNEGIVLMLHRTVANTARASPHIVMEPSECELDQGAR